MTRPRLNAGDAKQLPQFLALLNDERLPHDECNDTLTVMFSNNSLGVRAELWEKWGAQVIAEWSVTRPGKRPSTWWKFAAPRQPLGTYPDCYYDGQLEVPRVRVGGRGTPCHAVLGYAPLFEYGLPRHWINDFDIGYYTGTGRDINGKLIAPENAGKYFSAEKFDPKNPPLFESQALYLKRLGLLLPGELRRLSPAAFANEPLPEQFWPRIEEPMPDIMRVLGLQ
jgi:hypothetical protein